MGRYSIVKNICFCSMRVQPRKLGRSFERQAATLVVFATLCLPLAVSFSIDGSALMERSWPRSCTFRSQRQLWRETSRPRMSRQRERPRMTQEYTVTLKIALDSNGAVDDLGLTAKRFTCAESLDAVHRLRRDSDAVLVGVSTVARDDPSLTVRRVEPREGGIQPTRVVIDPSLRVPPSSTVLKDGFHTVIACSATSELPPDLFNALSLPTAAKVELFRLPTPPSQALQLELLLDALAKRGIREIMVEGGPATARRFLQDGLVDRAIVIRAPVAFDVEPVESHIDDETLAAAGLEKLAEHTRWGCDVVTLWAKQTTPWPTPHDIASWP